MKVSNYEEEEIWKSTWLNIQNSKRQNYNSVEIFGKSVTMTKLSDKLMFCWRAESNASEFVS